MKTIGLIGGTSYQSSIDYYKLLNEMIGERLGGYHSCKCIMYSVDFDEVQSAQHEGRWQEVAAIMTDAAKRLERGGADFIIICANTLHKVADSIQQAVSIPIVHIVDAAAEEIKYRGLKKVGLLGTKFTMEQGFYKDRLRDAHNIETIVPEGDQIDIIHSIIFDELVFGILNKNSKEKFLKIIRELEDRGAEGIILGCTEIPLLVKQEDCAIPLFDTAFLHVRHAVDLSLK